MSPSRIFIERPVATSLLMAAILLSGIVAYFQLPVSALPQVDYPTIQVLTFYPGASPDVMASSVTAPLERQFGQMPGLNQMTSSSSFGSSLITLQFDLELSLDVAEQEVQASINAGTTFLPKDLPNPPIYSKTNPADAPIITLALTSDTLPLAKVEDLADTRLAQKISQLPGVGLVSISGGQKPAVRIQANPTALAAYGMSLEDLRSAVALSNVNQATGNFDGPKQAYTIDTNDQIISSAGYRSAIIAYRNGGAVRLSDVATVIDDAENVKQSAWSNKTPAVILNIQRQPGANIIGVVDRIEKLLPQLKTSLPSAINLSVLTDRTTTIRASVKDVQFELMLTVALVVLVIFLFLRTLAATVIPSIAVPLSLVGTFGVMYLLGYSLDNLSLMALTISTGFVVDDAIVVIENITRHLEAGMRPMQAALLGAQQIGFTVLSMSTSLVAVFIPILLMGGIVGRLFREFAVTLSIAIALSSLVSLTLTPMMCAKLLRSAHDIKHGWLYRASERFFNWLLRDYDKSLSWVLRHPQPMLLVTILTICLSIYLYIIVPKGFFPDQDTGRMMGNIQAAQDISYQEMRQKLSQVVEIILKDPAVDTVGAFTGGGGGSTTNTARMFVSLKSIQQRKVSASDVINRLRGPLSKVPGAQTFLRPVQDINVGGRLSNALYQYTLQGDSVADLTQWTPLLMERMRKLPQLTDVNSDQQNRGLVASLDIDRDTAARLGLNFQLIDNTLYDAFGQRQVSTMYRSLNQYHVVMEVAPQYWQNPETLKQLYVQAPSGAQIPFSAFAKYKTDLTPLAVNHQGLFPATTISFNLAAGVALGDAVQAIQQAQRDIGMPASIQAGFQGTAQAFQSSLANEWILIVAALLAVYIVLGILYESYIHPITILSTLPSAGVGALLALLLFKIDLTIIALIGIILLIGIVKKNAIMMIDFALEAEREHGRKPEEAIYQACLLRFRPIMMTTLAALLGGLPLAFGRGTGAELRQPLGITIVGGLIVSQMLTLFTTPVVYMYLDRLGWWLKAVRGKIMGKRKLRLTKTA
ncbi:MAG: multidrug efflux RND transporter permease subunit [Acidobacteria bacterium]|nr:multidrug efflux RND transporter permease subunit [Acidobacteriota bacterium]MBI3425908.1 multidrug efflux RND transporter permease subunit [Acidobacteriota bacterium]